MWADAPGSLRAGTILLAVLAFAALAAPWLAPYDPSEQLDPACGRYRPPGTTLAAVELTRGGWLLADRIERTSEGLDLWRLGQMTSLAESEIANLTPHGVADWRRFALGSDRFGRDVLSRLLHGARISLGVGLLAVGLALSLGVAVGSFAGLRRGLVDLVVMRGVEAFLAFPRLFLALTLAALFEPRPWVVVAILGGTGWMAVARLTRARVLEVREQEYVLAATSLGQTPGRILRRHILPNALTPVLVDASLRIGDVILLEASLSFLGLGIQPPTPTWGGMVAGGVAALESAWWLALFPGLAIAGAVIGFNLLGDGLRERLQPRERIETTHTGPSDSSRPALATRFSGAR